MRDLEFQLRSILKKELDRRKDDLTEGNIQSYEEFRHIRGIIGGLTLALDALDKVQRQIEEED